MFKSKVLKSSLIFSIVFSLFLSVSNFASAADSGLHEMYYKMYAPKSQTTYKQFGITIQKVSTIKKVNSNMVMYGGMVSGGGALGNFVKGIENVPYVGTAVRYATGAGGAMVIVGTYGQMTYSKFKNDSLVMHRTYFKWTNAARLEYAVKIESWVAYKGKPVTKVKTTTFTKTL